MNYQCLKVEAQDSVWTVTIARPEALNGLNSQVLEELDGFLKDFSQKSFSEAKVLILTGAGEKAFVAGADIKEINSLDAAKAKTFAEKGQRIFRELELLKVPVIAAVNGFALGGGLELAMACDFIYASENAKFGLPEVSLGLIPGFGGTVRLARSVGLNRAREMTVSGDMISSAEALQIGLVNKVVPLADLKAQVQKVATTIAARGPLAVAHAKKSILESFDLAVPAAMAFEASQFSELFKSLDVKEGTEAFMQKRKAQFTGK